MSQDNVEQTALLSKSLALLEKTIDRIKQMDTAMFPSNTSDEARKMLLKSLEALRESDFGPSMPIPSLFRGLIDIQSLVDDLDLSHIDSVSWPIVKHCDTMWVKIFGEETPLIFYSTTRTHNYNIAPFSESIRDALHVVLPRAKLDQIINKEIYCLHLASLENDNLALYANIAHEFGHAMYSDGSGFAELRNQSFPTAISALMRDNGEPAMSVRQRMELPSILHGLAKELFADSFAAFTFGPAFFLSLYEMKWGGTKRNTWNVFFLPTPKGQKVFAHPSGNYRLGPLKKHIGLESFIEEVNRILERSRRDLFDSEHLRSTVTFFEKISTEDADGVVSVRSPSDCDHEAISIALNNRLPEIRRACDAFVGKCWDFLREKFPALESPITAESICSLLERLENDILPNIIPVDGTLRGIPAKFEDILLASAIYRMSLLLPEPGGVDSERISNDLRKLERLARKSFEATWIQQRFNEWKPGEGE